VDSVNDRDGTTGKKGACSDRRVLKCLWKNKEEHWRKSGRFRRKRFERKRRRKMVRVETEEGAGGGKDRGKREMPEVPCQPGGGKSRQHELLNTSRTKYKNCTLEYSTIAQGDFLPKNREAETLRGRESEDGYAQDSGDIAKF